MSHRSNQAVASQDRAASQPDPPSTPGRFLVGWVTVVAALTVSTALLAGGIWFARIPLAAFFLAAALSERGAEADFEVASLDLHTLTLVNVRFGAADDPDASIRRVEADWNWSGLIPKLASVRLIEPDVRLRLETNGRISAGALQRLGGEPGPRRPSLPAIGLAIETGRVRIAAPFGMLQGSFEGSGILGRDFALAGRIPTTTQSADGFALEQSAAAFNVISRHDALTLRIEARVRALNWTSVQARDGFVRIVASAPLDLGHLDADARWSASSFAMHDLALDNAHGSAAMHAQSQEDRLALADWRGQARLETARASLRRSALTEAIIAGGAEGEGLHGAGRWLLTAGSFAGFDLTSPQPRAEGDFTLNAETGQHDGRTRIELAQARFNERSMRRLRAAFPAFGGAPIGPTFAKARGALTDAARDFTFSASVQWTISPQRSQVRVSDMIEATAANGVRLTLAPLRQDRPAMVLQFPGATLNAAVEIKLGGGGAPQAALLLDSVDWAPEAPLEAEGALSIADWRAPGAQIAADNIDVALVLAPGGGGRIDLAGPARFTGPLGDGAVRDLEANLNVAASWGDGWRLTTNSRCVPARFATLEMAGLSFSNGGFSLCQRGGALLSASANGHYSGAFSLEDSRLAGAMRTGEPARFTARSIEGRFGGAIGDLHLRLNAEAPTLAVDLSPTRRLSLTLAQLSADAQLASDWRVEGEFSNGALSDPVLPGTVSAIAGAWNAAPENGKMIVRVNAAEALVTAHQPTTDAERTLFNPIRLAEVEATMQGGAIDAQGALMPAARELRFAHFTATHSIGRGQGSAHVSAENLAFAQDFQPYDITERLRGMVESVRGEFDAVADVSWSGQRTSATGAARLHGVSLATATMPIIENVSGEIAFDDLFALTTPPSQRLDVGLVNPGVAVRDGRVQFQLLRDRRVAIERAEFAYAGGELSLTPTTIQLGATETRFELKLNNVDAANLIASLNMPDLAATGRLEGTFPLVLSRQNALIQNGVLRALPGGGTLSYVGHAGEGATGAARIAFDALRSFRYDELEITLDGDLGGEVVSAIEFSGENTGRPVDLGPIAPVPGLGNVTVRGVPFVFNVRVTAPFRRLAQTAASVTDPGVILRNGRGAEAQAPVDQRP